MTRILILLVAGSALTLLPGDAPAGCHAVHVQKQAVVAYQPFAAPYYYSVGSNLQTAASEERIASLVIQKLSAMQSNSPGNLESSPERLPITAEVDNWSMVKANCAACHSTNAKAMEAVDMTSLADLSCETKLAMAAAILDSKMPPKKQLDPSVIGNLLGEIVGAETVEH